jgi:hypothetical protein
MHVLAGSGTQIRGWAVCCYSAVIMGLGCGLLGGLIECRLVRFWPVEFVPVAAAAATEHVLAAASLSKVRM